MPTDALWRAFASTGSPALYLLYRVSQQQRGKDSREGEIPSPQD